MFSSSVILIVTLPASDQFRVLCLCLSCIVPLSFATKTGAKYAAFRIVFK